MVDQIPHIDLTIDKANKDSSLGELMKQVRPQWTKFQTMTFTDGLTNDLYGVYETDQKAEIVLVRVFGSGTELVIDRVRERRTLVLLNQHGCCQPVYATFNNGICYGYQEGVVLEEDMMRDDKFQALIAKEMARLHTIPIPDDYAPGVDGSHLFEGFPGMLAILPETLRDEQKNEKYQKIRAMMTELDMAKQIKELEQMAKSLGEPRVLCHHDLLNRNLVFNEKDNRVYFIDYEFAGLSYAAIDIAGHLLANIGLDNPNFDNFPGEEKQFRFLKIYLEEKKRIEGRAGDVADEEVQLWLRMVNKMLLVNYLFWGLFCILQETMLDIEFHFLDGAQMLFGAYLEQKDQLFAL